MPYDPTDAYFIEKRKGGAATPALLTTSAGETKEVPVIYDREGTLLAIAGSTVQSAKPQCAIQSKYFTNPEDELSATIVIDGVDYKITMAEPDTDGVTTLILSRD